LGGGKKIRQRKKKKGPRRGKKDEGICPTAKKVKAYRKGTEASTTKEGRFSRARKIAAGGGTRVEMGSQVPFGFKGTKEQPQGEKSREEGELAQERSRGGGNTKRLTKSKNSLVIL